MFTSENIYNYVETSPEDNRYNCIAWTFRDRTRYWWPIPFFYWPSEVPRQVTIEAFRQLYIVNGYTVCDNGNLEAGYEKVAIYVRNQKPTHAAKQLPNGKWSSKLSDQEDVEHDSLEDLIDLFGDIEVILRREIT